ncbi:hypothetical protein I543_0048 [Mycobacteroides abscessus 21]|uniref:Uncharacterized protein n=1 Tax=Mycobacteroides abscessus 21 TaxID=1299324 RepID=A0A829Q8T3_9MYCO|nr:hypothetical protein I543_0048 [Mycobacteroides abscessus 21]
MWANCAVDLDRISLFDIDRCQKQLCNAIRLTDTAGAPTIFR